MTNRVTLIIMFISVALLTYTALNGIRIGEYEILSVVELQEKNVTLKEKIDKASILTSKSYPDNVEKMETTFNKYLVQKQKYKQLTDITNGVEENIYETKQYDISYLWRVLGKYAKDRAVTLGIDVQKADKTKSIYNLNFTLTGRYVKISQFITDIENDSDLYFRIYNFKMTSANDGENPTNVIASFTVRNVNIDPSPIK